MEWQPIETAPRDGTPILTYHPFSWPNGDRTYMIDVSEYDPRISDWVFRTAKNYIQKCAKDTKPTHWMPLPPPLKEETNK